MRMQPHHPAATAAVDAAALGDAIHRRARIRQAEMRPPERLHADAIAGSDLMEIAAGETGGRSAALLRERAHRQRSAGAGAGLPLSGDHQPLQSAVHHLPAHL